MSLLEYFSHFKHSARCIYREIFLESNVKYVMKGCRWYPQRGERQKRGRCENMSCRTTNPALSPHSQSDPGLSPWSCWDVGNNRVLSVTRQTRIQNNILFSPSSSPPGSKSLPAPASWSPQPGHLWVRDDDNNDCFVPSLSCWSLSQLTTNINRTTISDKGEMAEDTIIWSQENQNWTE